MSSPLNKMNVKALKALCKEMKLKKYSKLKKAQLITMIQNNQVVEEIKESTPVPVIVEEIKEEPLKPFVKPSLPSRRRKTRKSLFPTELVVIVEEEKIEEPVVEEMKKEILEKLEIIEKQPEKKLTKHQTKVLANTVCDYDLLSDDEESEDEEDDYKNELEEIELRMAIVDELNLEEQKQKIDEKYSNKIKQGDVVEIEWVDNILEDLDDFVQEEYDEDIKIEDTPIPAPVIDTTEAPLPLNLCLSPMTPVNEPVIEEPIVEESVVEEIDYSKMKVKELKALCKSMKIKKYSKLKKAELISMIKNNQ